MPLVRPFDHQPGKEQTPPHEDFRSDDALWLFHAVPAYVAETGELEFYHKVLPYADHGRPRVLGHLRRALEFNLERSGRNGLPSGLAADWNDCCNLGYTGESVMVAFQVCYGLQRLPRDRRALWAGQRSGLGRSSSETSSTRAIQKRVLGRRVVHLGHRQGRHALRHEADGGGQGLPQHAGLGRDQRRRHRRAGAPRARVDEGAPGHAVRLDAVRAAVREDAAAHHGRRRLQQGHQGERAASSTIRRPGR